MTEIAEVSPSERAAFLSNNYDHSRKEMVIHIQHRRQLESRTPLLCAAIYVWIATNGINTGIVLEPFLKFAPLLVAIMNYLRFMGIQEKIKKHISHLRSIEASFNSELGKGFETYMVEDLDNKPVVGWLEYRMSQIYWFSLFAALLVLSLTVDSGSISIPTLNV